MASFSVILVAAALVLYAAKLLIIDPFFLSSLRHIPGPKLFACTRWRLAYEDWKGTRTRLIYQLHQSYGPAVRIGPNEVSFNSLSALRIIYGPGSKYGRTDFYRMFDVYDRQIMFSFHSTKDHADRKRLLANAYSKSNILKGPASTMIEEKAREYMSLLEREPDHISDVFVTLHYYSLDNITKFLYGKYGSTSAMEGSESGRALLDDLLSSDRRKLSWFTIHFPSLTTWLYTRTNLMERAVAPFLPMKKPAMFTGVRKFALQAYQRSQSDTSAKETCETPSTGSHISPVKDASILGHLTQPGRPNKLGHFDGLDIASECADHFLAGLDTTSDTLMFLIWSLSQPKNRKYQEQLRREVLALPPHSLNEHGFPTADASDGCPYLHAIIKETLRLYAPLPAFEPRSLPFKSEIDGYTIPPNTTVGMSPYTLHRNPQVFKDYQTFDPDRWSGPDAAELNRWFWAFSSGGRMCIGMHLAMAEMTTLVATIYRKYETFLGPGFEDCSPGITARYEVFSDDCFSKVKEHCCRIKFEEVGGHSVD